MSTTTVEQHLTSSFAGTRYNEQGGARKPQYLFIHTVRFWSMAAIVLMHSAEKFSKYQPVSEIEATLMVQFFKFGTIAFFIISGFLIGDRLPASGPWSYLRRRVNRLVPAWAVWYGLWFLYTVGKGLLHGREAGLSEGFLARTAGQSALYCLVDTPLWFIPNFLVALACVVLLRRWLNDLRLGAALLAVNLFYAVNVYTRWIPSRHTEAVFGFVFYLWMGAWCALRKDRIQSWAAARSGWWLSFWAAVAAGLALGEMVILRAHRSPDPMNTLRVSNQLYSVLIVILLVRIQRRTWPAFVNVAETTYGIYLNHGVVINLVFAIGMRMVLVRGHQLGLTGILVMWGVLGSTIYLLAMQLTRALASTSRWGWTVGASPIERRKPAIRGSLPEATIAQPSEA